MNVFLGLRDRDIKICEEAKENSVQLSLYPVNRRRGLRPSTAFSNRLATFAPQFFLRFNAR